MAQLVIKTSIPDTVQVETLGKQGIGVTLALISNGKKAYTYEVIPDDTLKVSHNYLTDKLAKLREAEKHYLELLTLKHTKDYLNMTMIQLKHHAECLEEAGSKLNDLILEAYKEREVITNA